MHSLPRETVERQWLRSPWLAPVIIAILAVGTRLSEIDRVASFDELYHLLAARGWLQEGEFRIADGVYEPAQLFTMLVAASFALFGESIEVARMPSVLAGAALVVLAFLWTREVAGASAA
jgi:4-amino-4-deoxy-L-arabinose transferase-like glycosyltransferase